MKPYIKASSQEGNALLAWYMASYTLLGVKPGWQTWVGNQKSSPHFLGAF
jgi:hypothetical protein